VEGMGKKKRQIFRVIVFEKGLSPVNLSSCATSAIGLKIKNIKKLKC
jgi:hypothetical protein